MFNELHENGNGVLSISRGMLTFAPKVNKLQSDVFHGFAETPPFLSLFTVGRDDRNGSGCC
jgi:hypothetical protein